MAVNRDEILRELKVEEIQHPEAESSSNRDVLINLGKLVYTQSNVFADPRDIPDLGTVLAAISASASSSIPSREFTYLNSGADLTEITLDCTGTERPISVFDIATGDTIDFIYQAPKIYGTFNSGVDLSIMIMGNPIVLPTPSAPSLGVISSNPNTFTFTPGSI